MCSEHSLYNLLLSYWALEGGRGFFVEYILCNATALLNLERH